MHLKRFAFINWGNVPAIEFEFGPINLFSGGNGSGKTTAADAIQTIMTAAHENLFQYNPGQDETTQRGRGGKRVRTLASYVLGCDDGSYSRLEPTDGYLAAVFAPGKDEAGGAEPFTAVIAVRAWLERTGNAAIAREDSAQFYILPGVELSEQNFVQPQADGRHVVNLAEFQALMIQVHGKRRVERYDGKKAYLRRLYGALRGKADSVTDLEAVSAARTFSRFMAYKPVKSINRFVSDEILEPRDLGEAIRSVSAQLKTIHGMERDAAQLKASAETLDRTGRQAQQYIERWIELNLLDYTLAQAQSLITQQDYLNGKNEQERKLSLLTSTEDELDNTGKEAEATQQRLIQLEAKRQGIDALRQKDELTQHAKELDAALVETVHTLHQQDQQLDTNIQATRDMKNLLMVPELLSELPAIANLESQALAQGIIESAAQKLPDIAQLLQRDAFSTTRALDNQLEHFRAIQRGHDQWHQFWYGSDSGQTRRDQIAGLVHDRTARYNGLNRQRTEKEHEITRLENNRVSYPDYVIQAIDAIRRECPQADPRVLCDHVEIKDARWQMAIEGYLGGARYAILVTEDCEAEAIRIVRRLPGKRNKARVIQGSKARGDAARASIDHNSVIHVLEFSHAIAKAYLTASYGSVVRVESAEALRRVRRGITDDGMASGNYSLWRCDLPDSELVFGAGARERALAAKRTELEQLCLEWNQANDQMQQASQLLDAINSLKPSRYGDTLADILTIHRKQEDNATQLAHLDLSEHEDLEAQLAELNQKYRNLEAEQAELNKRKGALGTELDTIAKRIERLSDLKDQHQETVEHQERALAELCPVWPDFELGPSLDRADKEARSLDMALASNQRSELERALHSAERRMADDIQRHNQHCRPSDALVYDGYSVAYDSALFKRICDTRQELDRILNNLKNNVLVEKHAELGELRDAFNNAFVSHLCHAIYQALGEGKRQIELLNRELQHHRFGADQETFRFDSDWVPEFRDYARFFEDVIKTPGLGDEVTLFDAALPERSAAIRNQLMAMLLDDDETRAMRELARLADYRNYRRYEIYKEVEGKAPIPLSEYGTGSGGQLETPAYIIRSAAITSAFRFAEGSSHLKMVLVDEAFSKMDESRSREVIHYLTESLGLQLVFIMPTNKCGPYMDLISNEFVFAKVPSEAPRGELNTRVLVDRKRCNQERIQALWQSHRRSVYQQAQMDFMESFITEQ